MTDTRDPPDASREGASDPWPDGLPDSRTEDRREPGPKRASAVRLEPDLSRRAVVLAVGGGVVFGGVGVGVAQEDDEDAGVDDENGEDETGEGEDEETTDEDEDEDTPAANGGTETILVDDNFFEPDQLTIQPGTTVRWEWVGEVDHNINPQEQPDGADWEGHPELQTTGEYEFTFELEGDYFYICDPHVGVGMVGDIIVDPDADADVGEAIAEVVPDEAWTLIIATVAAMVGTLALAYLFMHFGGVSE